MESFRVPRAAQVWEVPVHTPDILAAADAVDAYLEAYRFSGDPRWLRDAVTWARRGLPFVYLWSDPQKPFLLGATIPVFGASWFQGSWFGRPVQWNGLRYAYAIQKLAEHDRSKPWRQIAEMIVRSAMYQQDVAGENVALWPDNISAVDSQKCPWVFSPREIIHCVLKLIGRDEEPQTTILGQGERRLHVTATAKIDRATWDGRTCSFRATYPAGEQGVILVANVVRPAAVYLDGRSLTERPDVEKGPEPGWRYDMGSGYLSIRVHHDGPALVRIDGAAFRHVERLPRLVERIAFEFDGSTEGWLALNDLGPLEFSRRELGGLDYGARPVPRPLDAPHPRRCLPGGCGPHASHGGRIGPVLLGHGVIARIQRGTGSELPDPGRRPIPRISSGPIAPSSLVRPDHHRVASGPRQRGPGRGVRRGLHPRGGGTAGQGAAEDLRRSHTSWFRGCRRQAIRALRSDLLPSRHRLGAPIVEAVRCRGHTS